MLLRCAIPVARVGLTAIDAVCGTLLFLAAAATTLCAAPAAALRAVHVSLWHASAAAVMTADNGAQHVLHDLPGEPASS